MDARTKIFEKYKVAPDAHIGGGMEAEVYDYGDDTVLKIYAGTATLDDLIILKDFYSSFFFYEHTVSPIRNFPI